MLTVLTFVPGQAREMLIALGAVRKAIDLYPEPLSFIMLVEDTDAAELAKASGLVMRVEMVDHLVAEGINPIALMRPKFPMADLDHVIITNELIATDAGARILARKLDEFRIMTQNENVPDIKNSALSAVTTAFINLVDAINTRVLEIQREAQDKINSIAHLGAKAAAEINALKPHTKLKTFDPLSINQVLLSTYVRIPAKVRQEVAKLIRKELLLEDGAPIKDSLYFVADVDDSIFAELVAELYDNNNPARVYPVQYKDGEVCGQKLTILQLAALLDHPSCVMVIGKNSGPLTTLSIAVGKPVFNIRMSQKEWPDVPVPRICYSIAEETLKEKIIPIIGQHLQNVVLNPQSDLI